MSDVWQGPGWWLASDGKWYPAEAEPGAVYEGDLENTSPAVEVIDPPTPAPAAPEPEPVVATTAPDAPDAPDAPEPVAAQPTVETEPAPPVEAALGADPFAQMPAPVVEKPHIGGWQSVDPVPPTVPVAPVEPIAAPLAATEIFSAPQPTAPEPGPPDGADDGWTSAYEERQDAPVTDPPLAAVTAPGQVFIPEVEIPAVEIPDVAMPIDVPADPVDTPVGRDEASPIERDDAWRKPSTGDDTQRTTMPPATGHPGVPDVVDLAIPEDPPSYVPEPQRRPWGVFVAAIAGLLAIAALAWLITSLFDDDAPVTTDDVTSTVPQDATPTSDASAPSVADTTNNAEENPDVSVFALRAGDCIVGDIGAGQVTKVAKVDCEEEHQFEVYREALIEPSITAFDEEAISAYAEEVCRKALETYIPSDDERGLKFKFLQPTEDSWNQAEDPDRVITCLLYDEDAPLLGRAGRG